MFTQSMLVRDIVNKFPNASDIFKQYRIDFCCGGNRPLVEATTEKGVDVDTVLSELQSYFSQVKMRNDMNIDWLDASPKELIQHIKTKHHHYLEEELPKLSPYVTKLMKVHGADSPHLMRVHQMYNELKTELEQHTVKEEAIVFPLIESLANAAGDKKISIIDQIKELEAEHDHAGDLIKEIRTITNDFTPPDYACGTYRLVYQRLEALESDLFQHIHLENNILFQKAIS